MLRRVLFGTLVVSSACAESPSGPHARSLSSSSSATPDKRALYADAALVPTREGERIRREVALCAEIELALRLLPGLDGTRVHVDLTGKTPNVAVFVQARPGVFPAEIRAHADAVVTAVMGGDVHWTTTITKVDTPTTSRPRELHVVLALALFGLGASVGVTVDRVARRRRRRRVRSRA